MNTALGSEVSPHQAGSPAIAPSTPSPESLQAAASTFGLLSATVRLHILWLLASGERDVSTLAEETGQTVATVSHHLSKLKLAGLVRARREGQRQVYLVEDPHTVDLVLLALHHHGDHDDQRPSPRRAFGA